MYMYLHAFGYILLLYTFPFLGCMYMPVCMQESLADQPHNYGLKGPPVEK